MSCGCEVHMDEERKATVHLPTDEDMSGFELGDEVTITIKGTIKSGRFSLKKEDWDDAKGHLEVEVDDIKIDGKNVFQSMID